MFSTSFQKVIKSYYTSMNQTPSSKIYDQIKDAFNEIMEYTEVPTGTILHSAGLICNNLYFVEKGALRAFYYFKGNDVTAHFATDRGSITAPDSFIKGAASKYNIETLTDSKIHIITKSRLNQYLSANPKLERLARLYTEEVYMEMLERVENMVFLTAQERYKELLKSHPGLDQKVNLGHISSYLGITQETLSRVRRKT